MSDYGEIDDGFGSVWPLCRSGCRLEIVRPGKVQCECDSRETLQPRVFVRRSRNRSGDRSRRGGIHYWNVYDCRGPKVFIRQFTFSYYEAALKNAIRLAHGEHIDPRALFGVQRVEYGSFQDPLNLAQ